MVIFVVVVLPHAYQEPLDPEPKKGWQIGVGGRGVLLGSIRVTIREILVRQTRRRGATMSGTKPVLFYPPYRTAVPDASGQNVLLAPQSQQRSLNVSTGYSKGTFRIPQSEYSQNILRSNQIRISP